MKTIGLLALAALALGACKDSSSSSGAAASASVSGGDGDVLPPVELTEPKPKYALADLSDKQVEALVARAGWTPTVVGRSPPEDEAASTIRVAGFQGTGSQRLESVVFVRCRKDDKPPRTQPGEAFFRDGACHMQVAVRLGIRNKTAESKRLLEALLKATPN